MILEINNYQLGERPDVTKPDPEFYNQMGEEGIRNMVSRHYDLMRQSDIKGLFSTNDAEFTMQKQHSADFMVQICGGTDYYNQHRGKPMMINRHAASSITPEGRLVWLNCYKQALLELSITESAVLSFWNYINVFSAWMVNTPTKTYKIDGKL
jgi:hemoglobin